MDRLITERRKTRALSIATALAFTGAAIALVYVAVLVLQNNAVAVENPVLADPQDIAHEDQQIQASQRPQIREAIRAIYSPASFCKSGMQISRNLLRTGFDGSGSRQQLMPLAISGAEECQRALDELAAIKLTRIASAVVEQNLASGRTACMAAVAKLNFDLQHVADQLKKDLNTMPAEVKRAPGKDAFDDYDFCMSALRDAAISAGIDLERDEYLLPAETNMAPPPIG